MSAPVLVTGGGGFIGRAIVERLLQSGVRVRVLGRGEYPDLAARGVECIRGDITDEATVERAIAGCDTVFHVAAKAGVWGRWDDYVRPNVWGTRKVIRACKAHGAARLVFTSSPSVVFDGHDQRGLDETAPYPARFRSAYSATKAAAEHEVLAANSASLGTIVLRPHLVWGPGDNHIVPRILEQGRRGKLRIIGKGDAVVDTTYIDNAADAHLLAAEALANRTNAAGRAYFITNGEPKNLWEIVNGILDAAGQPPVQKCLPRGVALAAATTSEFLHRLLRRPGEPRITRFLVEELSASHWFSIEAARRELGYGPVVTIKDGLRRLAQALTS